MLIVCIILVAIVGFMCGYAMKSRIDAPLAGALKSAEQRIDEYRTRWQSALQLLGDQGRLTKKEVASLMNRELPPSPRDQPAPAVDMDKETLYNLPPWARRDLAIDRAKNGLPPADDLKGLPPWAVNAIVMARNKYAKR